MPVITRSLTTLFLLLCGYNLVAQPTPLHFQPSGQSQSLAGWSPLQLFPLPKNRHWQGAGLTDRAVFALHAYAVPGAGPTADRANEAVLLGWNPLGRLSPLQPGYWWQYEWSYGQNGLPLFELNLDVRDSISLGLRRSISYKMNRNTGTGLSADFAFNSVSFTAGNTNAGNTPEDAWLLVLPGHDRFRSNLRTEFRKIVQHTVHTLSSNTTTLRLPLERGIMFSARLDSDGGASADSTHVILNSMESGTMYSITLRNDRPTTVRLSWGTTLARSLLWDRRYHTPKMIESGETIVLVIIIDEARNAYARVHGIFREQ
jgi:hypothetical protein